MDGKEKGLPDRHRPYSLPNGFGYIMEFQIQKDWDL